MATGISLVSAITSLHSSLLNDFFLRQIFILRPARYVYICLLYYAAICWIVDIFTLSSSRIIVMLLLGPIRRVV